MFDVDDHHSIMSTKELVDAPPMNIHKLKEAEARFFSAYPDGFDDAEMLKIGKKHKMPQMIEQCQELFSELAFNKPHVVVENMAKMISKSSMVSLFEKPKYRDYLKTLTGSDIQRFSEALCEQLYGVQQTGFEDQLNLLRSGKLAKWTLISILPNYVFPDREVFIKPTTAKGVIKHFELEGLTYKPAPSWDFYRRYRDEILAMKAHIDPSLQPNNAAFCGFLMMSLPSK